MINEIINNILMYEILHRPVWRFIVFLGIILATAIFGKILHYIIKNIVHKFAAKTETKFDDMLVDAFGPPFIFFVSIIGYYNGYKYLDLSESLLRAFGNITEVLIIIGVSWVLIRFLDNLVKHYLSPLTSKTKSDLDDHLVPIIRKLIKVFIVIIAALMILDMFGYNINSILAGLGLGGLAFALAAKDLLANLFGGIAIFTDKPFKIGHRIKIGGYDGTIQKIDLRTTKLKTLDGTQVTIPNSKFADDFIENITREPARKIKFSIGLTYDTKPAKVQKGINIIWDILKKHEIVNDKDSSVYFDEFADFSLNIKVIYFIDAKGNWPTIYKTKHDINSEILTRFNKERLDFAFPTQTIELHRKK
jgi:MscS family membrane protein